MMMEQNRPAPEGTTVEQEKGKDEKKPDIFDIEEIEIEEMAIDGICGVY